MSDQEFMSLAIAQARLGRDEGGIPIGAVLAGRDGVLSAGRNRRVQDGSPVLHAELDALARPARA